MDLPSVHPEQRFGGSIEDVHISDYVTVGSHSCILEGSDLPEGSAFGAFTLVKKTSNLLPYNLYVGHKCDCLGKRKNIELIQNFKERHSQ